MSQRNHNQQIGPNSNQNIQVGRNYRSSQSFSIFSGKWISVSISVCLVVYIFLFLGKYLGVNFYLGPGPSNNGSSSKVVIPNERQSTR